MPVAPGPPEITSPEPEVPGVPGPPLPIVVVDAAHGGEDAGARSRDGVNEKDVTAQLAARVRVALLSTRKYRILLTRLGDVNPSFEQREIAANTAKPVAYLSLHAGNLGSTTPRVAVFSYRAAPLDPDQPLPLLIPWNEVHRTHTSRSRQLAQALQAKLAQVSGLTADLPEEVPVRSLRSIDGAAVAIELGSLKADQDAGALTQVSLQQQLSAAIAAGLDAFRMGAL
jgi:N-acetylmuramoyl-L-alanine amidase